MLYGLYKVGMGTAASVVIEDYFYKYFYIWLSLKHYEKTIFYYNSFIENFTGTADL